MKVEKTSHYFKNWNVTLGISGEVQKKENYDYFERSGDHHVQNLAPPQMHYGCNHWYE